MLIMKDYHIITRWRLFWPNELVLKPVLELFLELVLELFLELVLELFLELVLVLFLELVLEWVRTSSKFGQKFASGYCNFQGYKSVKIAKGK